MNVDECLKKNPNAAKLLSTEHMKLGESYRTLAQVADDPHYVTYTGSYFIPSGFNDAVDCGLARIEHMETERTAVLCRMAEALENYFASVAGPNANVEDWYLEVNRAHWLCETMIRVPGGANMFVEMEYRLVRRPVGAKEAA